MLENPANAYGFAEDDFKQVVKDVGKLTTLAETLIDKLHMSNKIKILVNHGLV